MAAGPGGGHEHIHCSLKPLDPSLVPDQVAAGGAASLKGAGAGEEEGAGAGGLDRPLAVVAAKYYFNGDSNVVFRYRLYSFHMCPVGRGGRWVLLFKGHGYTSGYWVYVFSSRGNLVYLCAAVLQYLYQACIVLAEPPHERSHSSSISIRLENPNISLI